MWSGRKMLLICCLRVHSVLWVWHAALPSAVLVGVAFAGDNLAG